MNKKGFGIGKVVAIAAVVAVVLFAMSLVEVDTPGPAILTEGQTAKFATCSAITAAFEESANRGYGYGIMESLGMPMAATGAKAGTDASAGDGAQAADYSETNIQVEGVDEADIVKTDGKYIYVISKGNLVIAEAYPAENAKVVATVEFGKMNPSELFIDSRNETVLIFGNLYEERYTAYPATRGIDAGEDAVQSNDAVVPVADVEEAVTDVDDGDAVAEIASMPFAPTPYPYYGMNLTVLQLWDISDKGNPVLERTVDFEGNYLTSRKIGDNVYFVINNYPHFYILEGNETVGEEILPVYRDSVDAIAGKNEFAPVAGCGDIGYLEPINPGRFVTVASISMSNPKAEIIKETVVAGGANVYASLNNIYLAEVDYSYYAMPEPLPMIAGIMPNPENSERTNIHKFALDSGKISYEGVGQAPGHVLNQFSMDEHNGYFRIATTISQVWRSDTPSTNNVYVFNNGMEIVGKLEGLAPGEQIYSARFMGNKAYIVTFRKIDPLFVIDMSVPENPKMLGKLKIPGYSNYLHPIDDTHIIGFGKEAVGAEEPWGDFAWYQGIKIAVFDVSDVENPKEMYKTEIGDRGTDSYALYDHKAFLFDREKELLVIPVLLAEIDEEKYAGEIAPSMTGEFVFQGAYVYRLNLEEGFNLLGRITHHENDDILKKAGHYYYGDEYAVQRSLYMDDVLYTISEGKILMNALYGLELINKLALAQ